MCCGMDAASVGWCWSKGRLDQGIQKKKKGARRCWPSVGEVRRHGKKALTTGFHFDLEQQRGSLPDLLPLLLGPLKMYYSSKGFRSKLNSFNSLSAGKFRVHWIFYFHGKGQTNLNLSILCLQPAKPLSYLLWLSPDLLSRCCICKTVP